MDKLKMHSPNLAEGNIAKLAELFPNCITENQDEQGKLKRSIDFDLLRQELSENIVEGPQERFHLNWPGKREALLTANAPIAKTLRPCREESVDFDTTRNLFIEGDNLDALKLLQETYLGKVKMIYIDPPYNTGSDFIYEDDFAESVDEYLHRSNQLDCEGNRLVTNSQSNGRFHSDWLSMMFARLRLAGNFLTEDGAIFVSCDENEHPRLRLVMDEVFGQSNFVADLVWVAGRKNDSRLVSISHEYIVCYAKNKDFLRENGIIWRQRKKGLEDIYKEYRRLCKKYGSDFGAITTELKEWYRNLADGNPAKSHKHYCQVDENGIYFPDNISWPGGGGPKYEVKHPRTGKPVKVPSRGWMTSDPQKMKSWIAEGRVHFGQDENSVPCIKSYLSDREEQTPFSVFYQDGRAASKRLRTLMDGDIFPFPKDETVIKDLIAMMTKGDDLIMDFFAGSSTTAHATLLQNVEDNSNRRFIMVQLSEVCDELSEASRSGYSTIADISRERIRRAGIGLKDEYGMPTASLDFGFRVLKVDTSNMEEVYYVPDTIEQSQLKMFTENVKSDRATEDLLFQVLLDWGVDLSLPIVQEKISGNEVFFVDGNSLAACFVSNGEISEGFVKLLAERQPLRVVFRDTGFKDDSVKINVEQIFKLKSPHTDIKTI